MAQYYDIDDILADEELVPAMFLEAVNGVGLLETNDTDRVEPRSKVELPFWLARELHLRNVASVSMPPCFNKKTREEIGADGAHVDLRSRCSYFYEFGCKIVQLIGDKSIGNLLLVAFQTRYKEVLIKAHTASSALTPKFLSLLTKEETKLYDAAKSSTAAFKTWRMGGPRFQKASVLGRKRKPALALVMAQYYDIDDILADEELVPAMFLEAVNGVGLLETNDTDRVEPRSKVELPFWLARELHLRTVASVSMPPCFNKKTREEIGADGAHVDLRSRCSYFYELGCKIVQLIGDKSIGNLLLVAFQTRYKEVLIKAHTASSALTPKFLSLLTKEETKLYDAAKLSTAAFKTWRMGGPRFQKASVLGRKRKPVGE